MGRPGQADIERLGQNWALFSYYQLPNARDEAHDKEMK